MDPVAGCIGYTRGLAQNTTHMTISWNKRQDLDLSVKIRHKQASKPDWLAIYWDLNLHRLYHSFKSSPVPAWQYGKTRMWPFLKPSLFVIRYSRILAHCHYWAQLLSIPATWGKIAERVYQSPNRRFHGSSCSRWSVQQPVVDHLETATVCIKTSKKLLWSLTCLAIRKWCVAQLTTGGW